MTSSNRWAAVQVTPPQQSQRKDGANIVISTVAGIVIYKQIVPYTTREQLLIYRSDKGWQAQLTGTEGKDVTDRLPQLRWEELYSVAQAALALTGSVNKLPLQEIF
jgi:hypothetical protein